MSATVAQRMPTQSRARGPLIALEQMKKVYRTGKLEYPALRGVDLAIENGTVRPDVVAKWAANAPLAFIDQYIQNLKQYRAISLDVGDQDNLRVDTAKLHEVLDTYGVANTFEIYSGTHTSAVADRFQNHVMPFFGKNLCSGKNCK